jgi:hypothetical protein
MANVAGYFGMISITTEDKFNFVALSINIFTYLLIDSTVNTKD